MCRAKRASFWLMSHARKPNAKIANKVKRIPISMRHFNNATAQCLLAVTTQKAIIFSTWFAL